MVFQSGETSEGSKDKCLLQIITDYLLLQIITDEKLSKLSLDLGGSSKMNPPWSPDTGGGGGWCLQDREADESVKTGRRCGGTERQV